MPSGTLQVYTALAENAAPLPGVTVLVLNEAGTQIARLTTNDVGSAPELVLTARTKPTAWMKLTPRCAPMRCISCGRR